MTCITEAAPAADAANVATAEVHPEIIPTDAMTDAAREAIAARLPTFRDLLLPEQFRVAHMALEAGLAAFGDRPCILCAQDASELASIVTGLAMSHRALARELVDGTSTAAARFAMRAQHLEALAARLSGTEEASTLRVSPSGAEVIS